MRQRPPTATRGILRPVAGLERFELQREAPPDDLAPFVSLFWTASWNLPDGEVYEQGILPFPAVNLACEDEKYLVHGPCTELYVAKLSGRGSVTGARFTPAGFSAFSRVPVRSLVDRVLPALDVLGREPPPPPANAAEARARLTAYLREQGAVQTSDMALADRVVAQAQAQAREVTAPRLAADAGISVRSLHRLLERHVGVSTKWIVRRARVQDAADRVARGELVDWAEVAQELGYHDQAHLIRDFRAQVGATPAAYAKRCLNDRAAGDASRSRGSAAALP
jgi:AraC-like DNA-binding protein